ncbi:hypothetical protein TRVA0_012S00958 [Trichomonascus vanleenenianus]|uniref:ATG3/ATG10 family protein n=1 Tax=Trichomonascus vanleenenianus TaxID=2268995 RepID=UPI003EC99481
MADLRGLAEKIITVPRSLKKADGAEYIEIKQGNAVYHVVPWNIDPHVPVLYLSYYHEDGRLVTDVSIVMKELRINFDEDGEVRNQYGSLISLSQTEHPIFGYIAFYLHPCRTRDFLDEMNTTTSSSDSLFLWLQAFGRYLGLQL